MTKLSLITALSLMLASGYQFRVVISEVPEEELGASWTHSCNLFVVGHSRYTKWNHGKIPPDQEEFDLGIVSYSCAYG